MTSPQIAISLSTSAPVTRSSKRAPRMTRSAGSSPRPWAMRRAGVAVQRIRTYRRAARAEGQQKLRELAAEAGLATERARIVTPGGANPWMLIAQQEQEHNCDLIVIGSGDDGAPDEIDDRARKEIQQLLPLAASLGQMILFENVWNKLHYYHAAPPEQMPDRFIKFVDSFNSPWVGRLIPRELQNSARGNASPVISR